mmetsp:Transcript_70038/g.116318  ORF Transcript_70038/g.116318 Transcript_70038/m.116318 type:complete len:148 (+) Transcript_70038:20-463(+)|eukprot:CAMPEP_0119328610 /NCGR_PEP_ID=MMETSP1333-20130426/73821_1 /TAXON_ID=418940 /ORGANISM="Scyphosphaera apsteinii, Strain RCC1455" /LENGTH=147 /DNA_ID=CAMNT_0007337523 /DNA_START=18 /DNA_END=461 /DNA_ORIENTATION=+
MKNVLVVAGALISTSRQPKSISSVLLAQRPAGKSLAGMWEFPGGKLEPGETPEDGLVRELQEELGITVAPESLVPLTFASHTYPEFHLLMPVYACMDGWNGEPSGREGQRLAWATADDLLCYENVMPPADIPLLPAIRRVLNEQTQK